MHIDFNHLLPAGHPLRTLLGEDTHHHKCAAKGCGTVWSHRQADMRTKEQWKAGHSCPACGTEQTDKCEADGSELKLPFKMTEREAMTILAALRMLQRELDDNDYEYTDNDTDGGRLHLLDADEIDHLAERIN